MLRPHGCEAIRRRRAGWTHRTTDGLKANATSQ